MSEEKSPKITLRDYISAKRPIIYINSFDFEAVDAAIKNSVEGIFQKEYAIAEYSPATGKANFQTKDPCERKIIIDGKVIAPSLGDFLRDFISSQYEEISKETIVVLKEVHDCLDDPSVYSALQTIAYKKNSSKDEKDNYYRITIIIVDSQLRIPSELEKIITVVDFPRPGIEKIKEIIKEELDKNYFDLPEDAILKDLAMRLSSFSEVEIKQLIRQILVKDQRLTEDSFKLVTEEKRQIIKKTGLLELIDVEGKVELQDFELFVEYIKNKAKIFKNLPDAKEFGVDAPSGVMLVGMPGCGKSLSATCVAKEFGCSLLKLDIGRMFGKYVGESEGNLRKAIRAAEAASPCVLWIDEIEKAKKKAFYDAIIKPAKFMSLPKLVFRQSKPAIIGIESLSGTIKQGQTLINKNGEYVGVIASMEDKGETLPDIPRGQRVAMAIKDAIVGKHFDEGDELYVDIPEKHYKFIEREFKDKLTEDEFETLYEFVEIKRKQDPDWGKFGLFE